MTDYWKSFWLAHAKEHQDSEPQIQVLRTLNKQSVEPNVFDDIVNSIVTILKPDSTKDLLDLCCGNGLITRELFNQFRIVTAVDLSEEFISQISEGETDGITAFAADARTVKFSEDSFDRILLYAGLQYFSESETVDLFIRLRSWICEGGLVLIGDIPDATRRWNFFNSPERESAYFESLRGGTPIVGNWFEPDWLVGLSKHANFKSAEVTLQPSFFPYQHYRFDLVLEA
jgi:cyclopropane fatty-acyl-phospholipid synthase-like methyltransferase